MTKTVCDTTRDGFGMKLAKSIKSIGKLLLSTHKVHFPRKEQSKALVILGNGPSLSATIAEHGEYIASEDVDAIAVNFAANAPEFKLLRPKYYILADPHFFANTDDVNVARLIKHIQDVDWGMTLFLPFSARKGNNLQATNTLQIEFYNAGADHTWTATLHVDEENHVCSHQPHFYKEDDKEVKRIRTEYLKYPLHSILYSFYLAFKSYHIIEEYSRKVGVNIYNSTPGSMIDAFRRRSLK